MSRKSMAVAALAAAFCLVASQAALGPSVAGLLRRNLERRAVAYRALEVRVAPLGWIDLASGRLRGVEIKARDVSFGGPSLAYLEMRLERVEYAPGRLLWRGEAEIEDLGPSYVRARVYASALNDYRRREYPDLPVVLQIERDRVVLIGSVSLWGSELTVKTRGSLDPAGGSRLRYSPEYIEFGRHRLPAEILNHLGQRLALEFPLDLPLPLDLRTIRLDRGFLDLTWTDRHRLPAAGEEQEKA